MRLILCILWIVTASLAYALGGDTRIATATRPEKAPVVDGRIDEACWMSAVPADQFIQYIPVYGKPESYPTEVRFLYTDYALYVGAEMKDPHPDSILRQFGNRDSENLNADYFAIGLDTYHNQLDAYYFKVWASGGQADFRKEDETYDAVWRSAVQIHSGGWSVEIEIPWSALRFPAHDPQEWGLQIVRGLRRYREESLWAQEVKGSANELIYWGVLKGIAHIDPPLRLSFTPYLSAAAEHDPMQEAGNNNWSYSYSGGLDLKYGLNEGFTLDMTLLPDFTQIKSDNKIKNLSAFETIYEEQRPFFNEAVDLFKKGDLFYSRRIGRTPSGFYSVASGLDSTRTLESNPPQARLINAFKLSGRNPGGLAIGVLNAITDRMEAEIRNADGALETVTTEPLTNYNIIVLDQALNNNSSVYLINTNVLRESRFSKANVTGTGLSLYSRNNVYGIQASAALSQVYNESGNGFTGIFGGMYVLSGGKVSGKHQYSASIEIVDKRFDANDLGITYTRDYFEKKLDYAFRIFEPIGRLRDMTMRLKLIHQHRMSTGKTESFSFRMNSVFNTRKYFTYWLSFTGSPFPVRDYYEPRSQGRFYLVPGYGYYSFGYSTDYRKTYSMDGGFEYKAARDGELLVSLNLRPRVRVNDHLFFYYFFEHEKRNHSRGFVSTSQDGAILFADRNITGVENTLSAEYNFRNDLSLSLWMRHYWYTGEYLSFFLLKEDGELEDLPGFEGEKGFSFNAFNVDLTFSWEFAPGSNLILVWKNSILTESEDVYGDIFANLRHTFDHPQVNTFSVKWLYYLDSFRLKSKITPRR